jgi:hypothetical protein
MRPHIYTDESATEEKARTEEQERAEEQRRAEEQEQVDVGNPWARRIESYSLPGVDVVEKVRDLISKPSYVYKAVRTDFLIKYASHNRASLSRLTPDAPDISYANTLLESIVQQRKCVQEVLNQGDNPGDRVSTIRESALDVRSYLSDIGATTD